MLFKVITSVEQFLSRAAEQLIAADREKALMLSSEGRARRLNSGVRRFLMHMIRFNQ